MKNLIYRFGFSIVAIFALCSLFAQEDPKSVIDSLSAEARNKSGEPKLKVLAKLAELELFSTNMPSRLDDLEREAKKQKNNDFLLYSYNYRITYYIRNNNGDSISKYTKLSAPIVKELDPVNKNVVRNESLKVISYTMRGLFDLALINQKKYLERIEGLGNIKPEILFSIYIGIGDAYYHQEKYEEALKYFNQAKNIIKPGDNNPLSDVSTLCLIALCHVNLKNDVAAIEYCNLASDIINDSQKVITAESRTFLNAYIDLIVIQAYSGLKDFEKAEPLVDQLIANLHAPLYQEPEAYCYRSLYTYYSGINEHDKALKYVESGLSHLTKNGNIIIRPTFIKEKASLLYHMQSYKEAYDELLHATLITDSIKDMHSAIQLDELATMYEVNLKDAEIAEANAQLKFTQIIIIALFVISILLLVMLLFFRINSKKQKAKNKILFKQQEELSKTMSHYKKMIIDQANNNTLNDNPLFQKLEEYMFEENVYKTPDISRDDIASVLNTNRQYLSSAIKDATGLTFNNYINKYRLEDARKQLLENDEVVIDDIIIEAGFSSRPTFHRLFKDQYGMAPHELKRASIALQNEIMEDEE